MWVLERPAMLALIALVPLFVWLRHLWPARGGRLAAPVSVWGGPRFRGPVTSRAILMVIASVAYWTAIVVLIVAAAGPTRTERERIYLTRGADIVLVVDQSASMAAQDLGSENRFETARSVIERFVEQRSHDHVGLVGFSAEAALRVPPTLDYRHLRRSLDEMQLMELGDGTAIGMGLALASLHLQTSAAPRRAIILLTDGVNNTGEISPEAAAEVAGSGGIRIYAIGVGSGQEASIEVRDPRTGQLFRGTIREGYDEATLRRVAEISGGRYYSAGSTGALEAVFDSIGSAEATERRVRVEVRREPAHRPLLLLALILLVGDLVIRRLIVGEAP